MNQNSRTRHFLAAPVLASLTDKMFNLGAQIAKSSTGKHHQYTNAYIRRENECVKSLLPVLESHLSYSDISSPLTNIIIGQVISDNISKDMLSFETTGMRVYKEYHQVYQ